MRTGTSSARSFAAPPLVKFPAATFGVLELNAEPTTPVAFYSRNSMLRTLDAGAVDSILHHAGPGADAPEPPSSTAPSRLVATDRTPT